MDEFDILGYNEFPVMQNLIIKMTKENSKSIDQEMQRNCKLLKLSSKYNFAEKLSIMSQLESINFPNLFIFIIEEDCFGFFDSKDELLRKNLTEYLLKFSNIRSMIVQLKSIEENITKFYFKEENSNEFAIIMKPAADITDFTDFPTFLWLYLNNKIINLNNFQEKFRDIKNLSLILKFLRILDIREYFFYSISIKCGMFGSTSDLLAVLDGYIDEKGVLQENHFKFFSYSSNILLSVFIAALNHSNKEIITFFMNNCKHFMKELPFGHQLSISRTAYDSNQIRTLCILLQLFDFPFPDNLTPVSLNDEELCTIIDDRVKFNDDILTENLTGIENFVKNNPKLRSVYNLNNTPAFLHALESENFKSLSCLIESFFKTLDVDAVKNIILKSRICCLVTTSKMNLRDIIEFMDNIKSKTDSKFIGKALKLKNGYNENLFFNLVLSGNKNIRKFRELVDILKNFLDANEIIDLMMENNHNGNNILQVCVMNKNLRQLAIIFTIFKSFFDSANIPSKFKELINQKTLFYQQNILQMTACWEQKEWHQTLWNQLLKTFDDREGLKTFIMQYKSFVSLVVVRSKIDIIEFTFKTIKEVFNDDQYDEIINSKGFSGRNLLHQVAAGVNNIETHRFLWKTFREFYKTDEKFVNFLTQFDSQNNTVFHLAAAFVTAEVLDFLFKELEKIASREEIKKILRTLGYLNKHLLQILLGLNKNFETFQIAWKMIKKYFNYSEIFKMIQHNDENGRNLLLDIFQSNSKEIIEVVLDEVKKYLHDNQGTGQMDIRDLLIQLDKNERNILHMLIVTDNSAIIEFTMKKLKEIFSDVQYTEILKSKGRLERNSLQLAVSLSLSINTQKILWTIFQEFHNSDKDFLNYLQEVDSQRNTIFHLAVVFSSADIFNFLITELEKIASRDEKREVLGTLGQSHKNLLQCALRQNNSSLLHQDLWKIIQKYFESSEILNIVKYTDDYDYNLLQVAVEFNTKDVVELTWNKIKDIFGNNVTEIAIYLRCVSFKDENIIHSIVKGKNEAKLKYCWMEVQKYFTTDQLRELVTQKTATYDKNIMHFASNCDKIGFHKTFWNILLKKLISHKELMSLIMQKSKFGNNFIHCIISYKKLDIIEFTFTKLKKILSDDQYAEVLMSKALWGRNLLHRTALGLSQFKSHEILWTIYQSFFKSDEKFLIFLKAVDSANSNYFELAVAFGTSVVFQFIIDELEKIASYEEIRNILSTLCFANQNILQAAARKNKSADLHKTLWKVIRKFFNSSEILDLIEHNDEDGRDLFLIAVHFNSKDIIKLTWDEIKEFLDVKYDSTAIELINYIEDSMEDLLMSSTSRENKVEFEVKWKKFINNIKCVQSEKTIKQVLEADISLTDFKLLHKFTHCDNLEYHKDLWKLLLQNFENKEELTNFLLQKNEIGRNFIHHLIINSGTDVIGYSFGMLKKSFNEHQYQQFLASTEGKWERNVLQAAASYCKNVKTHEFLWQLIRSSCKSDKEFLDMLFEVDKRGSNVFHIAASHTTSEIFEFMVKNLENEIIQKMFNTFGYWKENILQSTTMFNKSTEVQAKIWELAETNLNPSEIVQLISHCDSNEDNLLHNAVFWNTKETVELTWKNIQKYLTTRDHQAEYLRIKGHSMATLEESSKINLQNDLEVSEIVKNLNLEFNI